MICLISVRVLSTVAKGAPTKLSKANVIKQLNYENKALYGAVIKPVRKKRAIDTVKMAKPATKTEAEYSSEIYWQNQSVNRVGEKTVASDKPSKATEVSVELATPFTTKELHSITKFPLVPSANGIFENGWKLHEQHESDRYKSPSVNRILTATMPDASRQALLRWKASKIAELGEEGFQLLQKSIFERGTALHSTLETWLTGSDPSDSMIAKTGVLWKSVAGALDHVERPAKIIEQKLYHPYLHYNGVVDCITMMNGQYHVIEWKTSDNPKATITATYDAPIQLCAYLGALQANDAMRDQQIQNGAVVVAYTSGKPANVHLLNAGEMRRYWQLWLQRLQEYWTRYKDGTLPEPI